MRHMLILLGLLVTNVANAIDCQTPPDCTSLGYSTESDPNCAQNGYILCPFDEAYKRCVIKDCEKLGFTNSDKSSWCGKLIKCKGNPLMTLCQNLCEIGDVYYADRTCGYAKDYDQNNKNKIPVGVVVTVNAEGTHGKILALKDLTLQDDYTFDEKNPFGGSIKEIPFGGYHYSRTGTHSYTHSTLLSAFEDHDPWLWDGLSATQAAIVETPQTISDGCQPSDKKGTLRYAQYCDTPGPRAAMAFYPEGVSANDAHLGKGKWYVPSLGEWVDVVGTGYTTIIGDPGKERYVNDYKQIYFDQINATLSMLEQKGKASPLADDYYHSSSFFDSRTFWIFTPVTHKIWIVWTHSDRKIRPMTTF